MPSESNALRSWIAEVSTHLPHLSKPQAVVLALWSFGMVLAQSCGLTSVAAALAPLLDKKENTVRQRLHEAYQDAQDKKGAGGKGVQRRDLEVTTCFAPLVRWALSAWPTHERRLALALDATTLADRFGVLAISIVYRGCAIPVAWVVLPATTPGTWRPHWQALLAHLAGCVPADWTVIVLGGSRLVCPLAVSGHRAPPVASLSAHQRWRQVSLAAQQCLAAVGDPGAAGRRRLVRQRGVFQKPAVVVHPLGQPHRTASRGLAGAHRSGARTGRRLLVCPAPLDRVWLQGYQAGRLAVAAHPDQRSRPRHTPLVSHRHRHLVGGQRRR